MSTDDPARRGDWMQTYTGRAFWPLDPRADEIVPADIAHALSMLCRYGGHTRSFYSVAEHCVLMSMKVPAEHALWALLHDATEAYLVDLPRPIKRQLPQYKAIEDALMVHICARFGLDPREPAEVIEADSRILLDERAVLMSAPPRPWRQDEAGVEPLRVRIEGWQPARAELEYRTRLWELTSPEAVTDVLEQRQVVR